MTQSVDGINLSPWSSMYTQISVRGDDAESFLQGQLTQDIGKVSDTVSPLAAWCSPQGRVIASMRLLRLHDGIGMVLPTSMADRVLDGLARYRLRARVDLQAVGSDWQALAVTDKDDLQMLAMQALLPDHGPGKSVSRADITAVSLDSARTLVEVYGPLAAAGIEVKKPLSPEAWLQARVAAGIADITDANSEKFTPHMLNLDKQGAISFSKGCYTGQEIVARTEHRGNAKRRLAPFRASSPVAIGDRLELDGTSVGEVVAAAGTELLVLLPLELHGRTLRHGSTKVKPAPLQASGRM
jgi:tRNA-modifying protein YgfZ